MPIMIRDISDSQISKLKDFTGEKAASKAILSAASQAIGLSKEAEQKKSDCMDLMDEIRRMRCVIDSLLPLCTQVQEIAGQSDILNEKMERLDREYRIKYSYHY